MKLPLKIRSRNDGRESLNDSAVFRALPVEICNENRKD